MGYLLLAVMFYTVVKYSVKVWLELFYARQEKEENFKFSYVTQELKKRVGVLERQHEKIT